MRIRIQTVLFTSKYMVESHELEIEENQTIDCAIKYLSCEVKGVFLS